MKLHNLPTEIKIDSDISDTVQDINPDDIPFYH